MTKVNLGSGWHYLPGYVNVDLHYSADVQEDIRTVEFRAGSLEEVLTTHTIEHLDRVDGVDMVRRIHGWLRPGGVLTIETPERDKCLGLLPRRPLEGAKGLWGGRSKNKQEWHEWLLAWVEDRDLRPPAWADLPGEAHLYVWRQQELADVLQAAGFELVTMGRPQYHGGRNHRDCRVQGIKSRG